MMSTYSKIYIELFFIFSFLLSGYLMVAQCTGSNLCEVCGVTAMISNVQGATIDSGSSTITGNVSAGGLGIGNLLEVTATACGTVSFDLTLDFDWDQGVNVNWIHGVSFQSSPGWSVSQGNNPGAGWIYQNSIVGCCSGAAYDSGYYFDGTATTSSCCGGATPGNPADNYGVDCTTDCGSFVFSLEYCPSGNGDILEAMTFTLTDDGETGDWNQPAGCIFDLTFPILFNDIGIQLPTTAIGPVCPGDVVTLNAGSGCDAYQWSNGDSGSSIVVFPNMTSTYCVTTTNISSCLNSNCVDIIVEDCCDAMAGTVSATSVCTGDAIPVSVTGNNMDAVYAQYLVLTDLAGNIIETLNGNSGSFSPQPAGDYLVYSYNTDGVNSCGLPFPPFNTNMNVVDANCGVDPACGMVSAVPLNIQSCCAPLAGTITANPASLCPGGSFTATASGFSTTSDQAILLTDASGTIVDIIVGGSGTFTLGMDCANYEVCSYNYCDGMLPSTGSNISSFACGGVGNDCDITCTSISAQDFEPATFMNLPSGLVMTDCANIPLFQPVTWTDNCDGTGTIMPTETGSYNCNGGTLLRVYEYEDICGNFAQFQQAILVDPTPAATFVNPPANITLICGDPLPPLVPLIYDNGLSGGCQNRGQIAGTVNDNSNGCTGLVQYEWTGTDACGNILSHTQNIIYIVPCAPNHNLSGTESGIYDYETNGIITSTQIIDATARVDYDSAIEINMNVGFEVVLGATFNAFIDGCNSGGGGVNIQSESDNQ